MVTMEDISIALGCSINTVSKALNNKPDVSAKTRALVLETARKMGYVPNSLARSLVTKSSGCVGIVVPSVTISIYAEIVESIMNAASKENYSTFVAVSSGESETEVAAVETLYQRRVDGLIIIPSSSNPKYHASLTAFGQPIVYAFNEVAYEDAHFVGVDLNRCTYMVTQHLIDQGCKRMALLCASCAGMMSSVESGYLRCLEDNGIFDAADTIYNAQTLLNPQDAGYEIVQLLDAHINAYDGLVLEHEQLYFGVNRLLEAHGLSCPGDILVASSVGSGTKRSPYLSLTSVEANPRTIGEQALACLLKQIQGDGQDKDRTPEPGTLIVRKSSRKASANG